MENTLNITITLNDEQVKDLIVGNLNELPKEKLQDILLQSIKEVLTSENGQKLFITSDYYSSSEKNPSTLLQKLINQADITDSIPSVVNEAVSKFADNYPEILERCIKSVISDMFLSYVNREKFQQMWAYVEQGRN